MAALLKSKKKKEPRRLQLIASKSMPFHYVEAYKDLRTNLNFIAATENVRSFVMTSALPEESKSNVSINLAVALASGDKNVVVVDCDLRKPALHRYLKIGHSNKGLTNILSGEKALDECIFVSRDLNIHVITAGTVPPNPSELLEKGMPDLLEQLKERFDYVILDAPPVSLVTDAAILGRIADGAILVVRSRYAPRETVKLAKQKLTSVGVKIFGVVLTRFEEKKVHRNTGYAYSYQYSYGEEEQK